MIILLSILFPIICGAALLLFPVKNEKENRNAIYAYTLTAQLIASAVSVTAFLSGNVKIKLFNFTEGMPVYFEIDNVGRVFAAVVTIVWMLCLVFSYEYMKHEHKNKRYFGFYLVIYGILMGLNFAGNIVTYYAFYELMTILTVPLVIHNQSREAVMAALKYMFYSFAGAYMVLFGLFFVGRNMGINAFVAGGSGNPQGNVMLIAAFMMLLGFSVKAGMFPMHAWLPTAHPVAPAPASAVLSGIIVKGGVLGIIRVIFYVFGPKFVRGTWVQTVWMVLSLVTVFMGSMLAYREDILKKRLAYSTVSQLSYILFGLSLLQPMAFTGALLHVVFHAFSKALLFLGAGAIIYKTGCTKASELTGIGKKMPVTIWCFAFAGLSLIGIPPTGGFLSKWYLALGALKSQINGFSVIGPIILLVSALLTAGYLLPVVVKGFLPGEEYDYSEHINLEKEKSMWWMLVPMIVFSVLSVVPSIFSKQILDLFTIISNSVF